MELFVCRGYCKGCDSRKECPLADTLDESFKREMADEPMGELRLEIYNSLKEDASPSIIAKIMEDYILFLIKEEVGMLREPDIYKKLSEYFFSSSGIEDKKRDPRDQVFRGVEHSLHKIALRIVNMACGDCNPLFCHECCIQFACGKGITKI